MTRVSTTVVEEWGGGGKGIPTQFPPQLLSCAPFTTPADMKAIVGFIIDTSESIPCLLRVGDTLTSRVAPVRYLRGPC